MIENAKKTVSLVVPSYNEAMVLPAYLERVRAVAGTLPQFNFEFLFVDDGSQDATEALLLAEAAADSRVKLVCLSRNFGHQRAITAGLDLCTGAYIVVMDADLQDPPEVLPEILAKLDEGFDLVHTVRTDRHVDTLSKRLPAKLFYALMQRWILPELPENAGDFKGFNRRVLVTFRLYRERVRFLRGVFATLGFKQTSVGYVRAVRHAGKTKYPFWNILRLARDAVVSNSALPLRIGVYLGMIACGAAFVYCLGSMVWWSLYGLKDPLLTVLVGLVLAFSGAIMILLGLIGEYLKCIILEVKQRPLYIVRATHGLDAPQP